MKPTIKSSLALMMLPLALSAGARTTMTIIEKGDDARQTVYDITNASVITFGEGGKLQLSDGTTTQADVAMANIESILFDAVPEGVATAAADPSAPSLRQNPVGDILEINMAATEAAVEIYSVAGSRVLAIPAWRGEAINVAALPAGIYIARINNHTLKFIKK